MKTRIFSLLMILCLAVSLFPRPAAALEEDEPEAAAAAPRCTMAVAERQRGEAGFSIRLELTGELPEDSAVGVEHERYCRGALLSSGRLCRF